MSPSIHDQLAVELAGAAGVVMLIGGLDSGKTTLALAILQAAVERGREAAYVDADVGNTTVGPPACVGLKRVRSPADLEALERADRLHFVGSITPDRLVLQQVVATATLAHAARRYADLVVLDTTAAVSGVAGETLKYHKMELCRPDRVVALQRGSEMEPVVGMLRRFFGVEVTVAPVDPAVAPASPEQRAAHRAERLSAAFAPPLERWRVRPTVFAPTLPTGLNLERLDGMVVGVQDGTGRCLGLGRLENEDQVLRVLTNSGEGMQGLRLGSLRLDLATWETRQVNLREVMFGLAG
ncbi:MAG: Clp1/GlmU family protein [Acidimicrobiia bacterium]